MLKLVFLALLLLPNVAQAASGGTRATSPAAVHAAVSAPHAVAVSPDGTISAAPSGGPLTTAAGTWTWGSPADGRPNEFIINLNGSPAPISGTQMLANAGQLYVNTGTRGWYVWVNGFNASAAPTFLGVKSVTGGGTVACSPATGDVKCTGSAVPGPPGPAGGVKSVTGAGTVACSPGTGDVKCTGSAVPGPAGPAGPSGPAGSAGPDGSAGPAGPAGPAGGVKSVTGSGTVACSPTTGDVKCAGSSVPGPAGPTGAKGATGPAGPAGPQGIAGPGPINRGDIPVIGSACKDGDTLYVIDHATTPPKAKIFMCDYPNLVWMGPFILVP